jgi:disulfide oxidoreductase YuzD
MSKEKLELRTDKQLEELFPPLTTEEYNALRLSIKQSRQFKPILVMPDGTVIDGHHRLKICKELNREPWIEVVESFGGVFIHKVEDALRYAFDTNFQGRKHNNNFVLANAAAKAYSAELHFTGTREGQKQKYKELAWKTGISVRTIENVAYINTAIEEEKAPKDMKEKLVNGALTVDAAQTILRTARKVEDRIDAIGGNLPLRKKLTEKYKDLKYTKNADKKLEKELREGESSQTIEKTYEHFFSTVKQQISDMENEYGDKISHQEYDNALVVTFLLPEVIVKRREEEAAQIANYYKEEKTKARQAFKEMLQSDPENTPELIEEKMKQFDEESQ